MALISPAPEIPNLKSSLNFFTWKEIKRPVNFACDFARGHPIAPNSTDSGNLRLVSCLFIAIFTVPGSAASTCGENY